MCKLGYKHSEETKRKIRAARALQINVRRKGFVVSEETKRKMRQNHADFSGSNHPRYGKPVSQSTRDKISRANTGKFAGEKNPAWRGGITSKNLIVRNSRKYKQWRTEVFKRDNYTCLHCGVNGNRAPLQVDHIKPFALFPNLRFELSNGRTLCIPCHKQTGTWGHRTYNMSLVSHHR